MNFSEYQDYVKKTTVPSKTLLEMLPPERHYLYLMLGLAGEVGEIAEKLKKSLRDREGKLTEAEKEDLAKEMGDVLWYLAHLASEMGFDFDRIAKLNVEKLNDRLARGTIKGDGDTR